jgi:hypothetical protein
LRGLARLILTDIDRHAADRFDIMNPISTFGPFSSSSPGASGAVIADTGEFAPAAHLKNDAEALRVPVAASTTP